MQENLNIEVDSSSDRKIQVNAEKPNLRYLRKLITNPILKLENPQFETVYSRLSLENHENIRKPQFGAGKIQIEAAKTDETILNPTCRSERPSCSNL